MKNTFLQQRLGLLFLKGIGPVKARKFLQLLPDLSFLYTMNYGQLAKMTGVAPNHLKAMKREVALQKADEVLLRMGEDEGKLFLQDTLYSRRLKQCEDAPLFLFKKGNCDLNSGHFVSVVGTRSPTSYGLDVAEELIRSFEGKNITVVSGLAYGIDIHIHRLCLKYKVPTIAVLGHGLDRIYPFAHRGVVKQMLDQNGAILTEFLPQTKPDRENFPKRNRIVAGMSDAVIVIESKSKGGSMITANLGLDYNRDVFAVPGSIQWPFSEGCNLLISSCRAQLLVSPEAFLESMGWNSTIEKKTCLPSLSVPSEYQPILEMLSGSPRHLDDLVNQLSLSRSELSLALFELEMEGHVRQLPGMLYGMMA